MAGAQYSQQSATQATGQTRRVPVSVPLSLGPYYLCPAPPAEHRILTTDTGFVLRPEQFAALTIKGWRKNLGITPLDIPEYPNDRLPIDLVDPT